MGLLESIRGAFQKNPNLKAFKARRRLEELTARVEALMSPQQPTQ